MLYFLFLLGGKSSLLQCSLKLINSQEKRSRCLLLCNVLVQELTAVAGMVFTTSAFSVARGMKHSLLVSLFNLKTEGRPSPATLFNNNSQM